MGMVTTHRFRHFGYFLQVTGSLKPSNSFLTNIRSFEFCMMFTITSKAYWSLNNLKNWDSPTILGICCMPLVALQPKRAYNWHIQSEAPTIFAHNSSSNMFLTSTRLSTALLLAGFFVEIWNFDQFGQFS